jgi:hypothetical protein
MKSFREKYPGLTEEQLRIKYKIWEKEKEREQQIYEALKKKIPFSYEEGDSDTGDYFVGVFGNGGFSGVASDATLSGAQVIFLYSDGSIKNSTTDSFGVFQTPSDFSEGDIIIKGGIDTVTGLAYNGELKIDAEFFFKYRAITPFTHVANHIWLNTPAKTPDQAMRAVLDYMSEFIGIDLPNIDPDKIFNDDHVKLSIEGIHGAKEVQAINTMLEIHSDLICHTEAKNESEISDLKQKALTEIGNALLIKINGQTSKNYKSSIFEFHDLTVDKNHKDCCLNLIGEASKIILESLSKESLEATSHIQALNLAVKSEWAGKALTMTNDSTATAPSVWSEIENKVPDGLLQSISLPQI